MDKLKIDEVYILCTKNIADGRIIKFFKDRGIINKAKWSGTMINGRYHSDGKILLYSTESEKVNKTKINPWKRSYRKFPREMIVSDDKVNWRRTIVRGTIKSVYGTYISEVKTYAGKAVFSVWKYAKEID